MQSQGCKSRTGQFFSFCMTRNLFVVYIYILQYHCKIVYRVSEAARLVFPSLFLVSNSLGLLDICHLRVKSQVTWPKQGIVATICHCFFESGACVESSCHPFLRTQHFPTSPAGVKLRKPTKRVQPISSYYKHIFHFIQPKHHFNVFNRCLCGGYDSHASKFLEGSNLCLCQSTVVHVST